jgi:cysteine desulfurase
MGMNTTYYFDYAAATPIDDRVLAAMQPYFQTEFYNPSALYLSAKAVKKSLDEARALVARTIGARPSEIIFTAGGSEADNLAVRGVMERYADANIVVSAIEHEAVLGATKKYPTKLAPVLPTGVIDVSKLRALIDEKTVLLSVMLVNNEVGSIQPIHEVSELVKDILKSRAQAGNALPLYVHTDASQAPLYTDVHVHTLGVDLMTLNGGKIYGPKQSGALFVRAGLVLEPVIYGGGQEWGLRSGTENVANCVGFATALELAQRNHKDEAERLRTLRSYFIAELSRIAPQGVINGTQKQRVANNVHVTLPGIDNERLVMELDEKGIQCGVGSACSASSDEPSHVLKAMGLDETAIRSSVRFTMGKTTDEKAVKCAIEALASCLS